MVVFLANSLIPFLLGFFSACTTTGQFYILNTPVIDGIGIMSYKSLNNLNDNSSIDYSSVVNRTPEERNYWDWLTRFPACDWEETRVNLSQCALGPVSYQRYLNPSNYSIQTIQTYNNMILSRGTYQPSSSEGLNVIGSKCKGNSPRIYLFGAIDIFDPVLWIILTIFATLIPLAIHWYQINHVF
jgi:hypothetical protein